MSRALSSSMQCNVQTRSFYEFSSRTPVPRPIISHQLQSRFKSAHPVIDDTALTPFRLADIGEGIAEVELLQWYVEPGAAVHQFDRICQVQSDKASVEITSRYDGIVRELCAEVGGVVKVGEPLCFMETDQGSSGQETLHNVDEGERLSVPSVASDYSRLYEEESFVSDDVPEAVSSDSDRFTSSSSKVMSSPAVRKLGKEHGIDISTIKGSGPNGRVLKSDVLKIIQPGGAILDTANNATPATANANIATVPITSSQEDEIIPIRGYHRLMVKSMTSSLSVPHMVYTDEINVTSLQELRFQLKPICTEKGIKLTLLPFFLKAASLALNQYPVVNGSIDIEKMELIVHKRHDLGVAVDTPKGLVVVVVRGCEKRSVQEIAVELGRLFALAAEGNLTEDDISNPTFTLSNIGAIGGTYMSPVVLPPQVAIGAMGKIQRLPRFVNNSSNEVEAAQIMPISWGGDHRAIDGATMARFSNAWKHYVENPQAMTLEMR
ncbi:hypothetical protein ACHAWO_011833 [Cyclotella atomus]|uniref:Dihydrolipoamide acetyltransferase component of pyruvate dehydrogenase complex n=1 Tax=Cyclotella atomus TaxID=382360 RepID=A0ABD3PLK5_9STRA